MAPRIASRVPAPRGGEPEADLAGRSTDVLAVPAAPVEAVATAAVAVAAGVAAAAWAPPAAVAGGPGGGGGGGGPPFVENRPGPSGDGTRCSRTPPAAPARRRCDGGCDTGVFSPLPGDVVRFPEATAAAAPGGSGGGAGMGPPATGVAAAGGRDAKEAEEESDEESATEPANLCEARARRSHTRACTHTNDNNDKHSTRA